MKPQAPQRPVQVRAPGKLNLFFDVGPLRADGYHDVASVYQAVELFEDVWAEPAEGFSLTVTGSVDTSGVPTDDRNLALRAARLLADHLGYRGGVRLHIDKGVPVAGGMGGGSADAAATLVACNELWGGRASTADLHRLAAQLGADVPFALRGGTAVGVGRGDELSPAPTDGGFEWVVVTRADGLSTPEVYRRLDELRDRGAARAGARTPGVDPGVLQALRTGDAQALAVRMRNDLESAAVSCLPEIATLLRYGREHGALVGMVSGSGPSVMFLTDSAAAAGPLAAALSAAGHDAHQVHGPAAGARVVE